MPRRNRPERREIPPDVKYNSVLVAKFINNVMQRGKKSLAERIMYEAMDLMGERAHKDPLEVFEQAVRRVMPAVEVRPRRVGGATYQIPVEVRKERQQALAFRWIIDSARNRPGNTMAERLANELLDAYQGTGAAIKKTEDTHKMAEANKAFAHYRW